MVLLFTVNTYLLNKMRIYQKAAMTIRDKRVKVLNEVLNGIKVRAPHYSTLGTWIILID